tara:strand:- start:2054 stop:2263 length:210 start_codon:yes stop_codon:yes gene_type:complete
MEKKGFKAGRIGNRRSKKETKVVAESLAGKGVKITGLDGLDKHRQDEEELEEEEELRRRRGRLGYRTKR